MSKALVILSNNSVRVVEPDVGLRYYRILHGDLEPDEEDAAKVIHIRHINLPPSYQPSDYIPITDGVMDKTPVKQAVRGLDDENSLHNGVLQGKSEILPRGDR